MTRMGIDRPVSTGVAAQNFLPHDWCQAPPFASSRRGRRDWSAAHGRLQHLLVRAKSVDALLGHCVSPRRGNSSVALIDCPKGPERPDAISVFQPPENWQNTARPFGARLLPRVRPEGWQRDKILAVQSGSHRVVRRHTGDGTHGGGLAHAVRQFQRATSSPLGDFQIPRRNRPCRLHRKRLRVWLTSRKLMQRPPRDSGAGLSG